MQNCTSLKFPVVLCLLYPLAGFTAPEQHSKMDRLFSLSLEELTQVAISTGTRSSDRTYFTSPVPVDVITAEQLEKTGFDDLGRALQRLVPSFNVSQVTMYDTDAHVRAISLRGMHSDQVLVLINGKRIHQTALLHPYDPIGRDGSGVDLATIPMHAVDRVEILKDGAAAQYGSDAIAGVINIILKNHQQEPRFTAIAGETIKHDGRLAKLDYEYGKESSAQDFLYVAAGLTHDSGTNRAGADRRQQYFSGDARNLLPAEVKGYIGSPKAKAINLMYNYQTQTDSKTKVYSFASVNYRESESAGFFRRPLDDRNVRAIYPDGFLPWIAPNITDMNLVVGARDVSASGLDWNFSNTLGYNQIQIDIKNSLNTSLGTASPTSFDAGTLSSLQYNANLDLHQKKDMGWDIPMSVGYGLAFVWERYRISAGEPASYIDGGVPVLDGPNMGNTTTAGSQVYPGFTPDNATNVTRNNLAGYIDLEQNFTDKLLGQAATRYEHYQDFGSSLTGKLAGSYKASDSLVFRASTSSGFRAPSLAQSYYSSTYTNLVGGVLTDIVHLPVSDPVAKTLGATSLKPEKSLHLSFGSSYRPQQSVLITADLFHNQIRDRIVGTGTIDTTYGPLASSILTAAGLGGVSFMTNAADTKTSGVDLSFTNTRQIPSGKVDLSAEYQYSRTEVTDVHVPGILGSAGLDTVFGNNQRVRIEDGQPKDKFILTSAFQWTKSNLTVRAIRFGSHKDTPNAPTDVESYGAKWIMDVDYSYLFTHNLELSVGGHNIQNKYPDYFYPSSYDGGLDAGPEGIWRYTPQSPFGSNGAFYYVRLNYTI